jgi:hypothetical protein
MSSATPMLSRSAAPETGTAGYEELAEPSHRRTPSDQNK